MLIEAEQQTCAACTRDRRRAVDNSATRARAAALEDRHVMDPEVLYRSFEPFLFAQCPLGVDRLDPLGGGTTIGRQEARLHAVPVELPAGIVADALQPYINEIGPGDFGEFRDEIINVLDQQISHVSWRHIAVVQMRLQRKSKVAGPDENT